MVRLRDRQGFWVMILVTMLSIMTLAAYLQTGLWVYVVGSIFGHIELTYLGAHLWRTRKTHE